MSKKHVARKHTLRRYIERLNVLGVFLAVIFHYFSLTPSLLPRPWTMQGAISGISLVVGYGIGVLLSFIFRRIGVPEPKKSTKTTIKRVAAWVIPLVIIVTIAVGHRWQNEIHVLLQEPEEESVAFIGILAVEILVAFGLLSACRGIRSLYKRIERYNLKYVPRWVASFVSLVIISLVSVFIVNNFLFASFTSISNSIYSSFNESTPEGLQVPDGRYRSGGEGSFMSWDSIGYRGKQFVARGPTVQSINEFNNSNDAKYPIRIYAGVNSADTIEKRTELIIKELNRTNASSRKVLVVGTATGSGWIEPQTVDALEYMHNGDTVFITQQYSYLPSWISFLVDEKNATDTGRVLFDAVYEYWSKLPENNRPALYAYGLSLGSFGSQAAFSTPKNLIRSVDGAMFVGTPSTTELWQSLNETRDKGSPMWQPINSSYPEIRWASSPVDVRQNTVQWPSKSPRILYLQHASDPVIWWNPDLILHQPDWLAEERGPDVSPRTKWIPFVTFFQVSVDQFFGVTVPNGHGHNYPNAVVAGWESVTKPENWNSEKAARLEAIINGYTIE